MRINRFFRGFLYAVLFAFFCWPLALLMLIIAVDIAEHIANFI